MTEQRTDEGAHAAMRDCRGEFDRQPLGMAWLEGNLERRDDRELF